MNRIRYTLLTDGSSDASLQRHIDWLLRTRLAPHQPIDGQWADLRASRIKPQSLAKRIQLAVELYECEILLVHRDAEKESPEHRVAEIHDAARSLPSVAPVVCVVPVRMMEAWLLFDETAIRRAAGNPNGAMKIDLPRLKDIERLSDPKSVLLDTLKSASGLKGRRLRQFSAELARKLVADNITDFSPLLQLAAFQRLESELRETLARIG